jgi:Zn-dependent protease/CBS domain-containing protein
MFGKSIKLFDLFGFTVRIDLSWVIILTLVLWSLGGGVFPQRYESLETSTHWWMAAAAALGLFVSIVVHELSHSLVARQFGLPMSGITLFLFGGVSEMTDEPPSPKAEFWMAIAGPATSVVLCVALLTGANGARDLGWPTPLVGVMWWVGLINGILAAFNLVPGFPMDGGRVLRSIIWSLRGSLRKATRTASHAGMWFGLVLIAVGIFNLLFLNPIGGLWWILIGMFLRGAAQQSYQQVLLKQTLQGEPVSRFMTTDPITVPGGATLEQLVNDYVYEHHFKMFPVVDDGRLVGCVTTQRVKEIPREEWSQRTVGEIASGCDGETTLEPGTDALDALQKMNDSQNSRMVVADDGELRGVLALKDLLGFLALKLELEGDEEEAQKRIRETIAPEQAAE